MVVRERVRRKRKGGRGGEGGRVEEKDVQWCDVM